MTDADLLELLNGAAIVPGIILIVLHFKYLVREADRRGLRGWAILRYPPSMNLMLSAFLFIVAVWGEKVSKWFWRFLGAGPFGISLASVLTFFGAMIVIAMLCKIRALTHRDFGNRPWLISASLSAVAALILWMTA